MTRRRWAAGALLLYLGLAVLLFWNAWTGPPNAVPGVAGDAEAHMWWLRWIPFAISHLQNPFFTDYIGYPQGVNVMWSNANVVALPALLLSPISLIAGVITAYRLMATLALALSAWCAYLACNRYVDRQPGAILGGLLYGSVFYFGGGLLVYLFTRIVGGITYRQVRHVLAFASAPIALSLLLLWPVRLAVYGEDLFRTGGSDHGAGNYVFVGLELLFVAWSLVLLALGIRIVLSNSSSSSAGIS